MLTSPTKTATFFDSSKFKLITKSIDIPNENQLSDDEFDEFACGPMEVDEPEDHEISDEEAERELKAFEEICNTQKGRRTDHLMQAIDAFVEKEEGTNFLEVICFLAQRKFYKMKGKRKLATVFKNIAEMKENYLEPNEIDINKAMAMKQTLKLSCLSYDHMRKMLKNKVIMPNSRRVSEAENALTPTPVPYMNGMKYDLTECMTKTIQRTFDSMKMKPEDVPKGTFFKSQPLVILTIFEFSRQTIEDTKLLENVAFQNMRFLTISNG